MAYACCAYGCQEKFVKGGTVTFHCFPKEESLRKIWELNIRRKNSFALNSLVICSKHFEKDCFDKSNYGETWLKKNAVPTIFNISYDFMSKKQIHKLSTDETAVITELKNTDEKIKSADFSEDHYQSNTAFASNMAESKCISPEAIIWGEKETSTLIALYELEPCLYDRKDPNYTNYKERDRAYRRIQEVMLYMLSTCSVRQIKNKIRTLCIQFITEKLAKECSIYNGHCTEDTYKSSLWCFELLLFLDDHLQVIPRNGKNELIEGEIKKFDIDNQWDDLADSEAGHHQNNEDGQSEASNEVEIHSNNLSEITDKNDQDEAACQVEKNDNHYGMNNKSDPCETSSSEDENSFSDMNDEEDQCETSSNINEITSSDMNDEVSNMRKRKCDCLVSSSKNIVLHKKLDKETILGLYISDEMKNIKKNTSIYLRTKQTILKILTNASFKLANVEL